MNPTPAHRDTLWRLGFVGFSYPQWAGNFYPAGLSVSRRLSHVAARWGTVEVNTTFYALPRVETVRDWARATPDDFRFCIKAPRDVTHGFAPPNEPPPLGGPPPGHLVRRSTLDHMRLFLDVMNALEQRLGVVLLQFPPPFTADRVSELGDFLGALSSRARFAVEFRHPSWWATPRPEEMLRRHSAAWAIADRTELTEAASPPRSDTPPANDAGDRLDLTATTDFLYVRWMGRHGQFPEHRRELLDPTSRLAWWVQRIDEALHRSTGVTTVYGLFDNEFAGHAPATASRFAGLVGVSTEPRAGATTHPGPTLFD